MPRRAQTRCALLLSAALLAGGCAYRGALDSPWPDEVPARAELLSTPFFPQAEFQCGPAALATVLNASGVAVTPAALAPTVYLPERRGSLQAELIASARRHARVPYVLAPRLEDLLREIAAGNPVVVLQNLGLSWYPRWHYAVAIGFDRDDASIILRSGPHQRWLTPLPLFARTWARGGHWALTVTTPAQIPATASELSYLEAVAALEQTGAPAAALRAYRAAHARWPHSLVAILGIGNSAYALGDKALAEQWYRRATQLHPNAGIAFNNLAQVLSERGAWPQAQEAIERALQLGGAAAAQFRQTQAEIAQRRANLPP